MAQRCVDCGSDVEVVPNPGPLDESFGPMHHLIFFPNQSRVMCPNCGEIGRQYLAMGNVCDVLTKPSSRSN